MSMKNLWRPIADLRDLYQQPLMIASPKLIDGDSNPLGIADAFWQDDQGGELEPPRPGAAAWKAVGYCMCHDEWHSITLAPEDVTHFLIPEGPWSQDDYDRLETRAALTEPQP